MYKQMYNPKSKIELLLLLSSIATMLVEIQSEYKQKKNKKWGQDKPIEAKKLSFFFLFVH